MPWTLSKGNIEMGGLLIEDTGYHRIILNKNYEGNYPVIDINNENIKFVKLLIE
ncbi:hypothetical protein PIROE2DRAFT_13587 [Piromyces sp. E2]|nr:hypothetical protein PIROE2DRAFT_13587 [Piromyces sp. E2]|eukprot:OUM60608.1 hypothetical protein PIROE2DRAFT_13587 [Piromyces sp. E2]